MACRVVLKLQVPEDLVNTYAAPAPDETPGAPTTAVAPSADTETEEPNSSLGEPPVPTVRDDHCARRGEERASSSAITITLLGSDCGPWPTALQAATVQVYGTPARSPVSPSLPVEVAVPGNVWGPTTIPPPLVQRTSKLVMGDPPSEMGSIQVTVAHVEAMEHSRAVAATCVGAPGTVVILAGSSLQVG